MQVSAMGVSVYMWCLVAVAIGSVHSVPLKFTSEGIQVIKDQLAPQADDDVYLFAVNGRKIPYSYLNEDGKLVGFDIDLISSVCDLVNKTCHAVLAEFTECIFTDRNIDYAGRGLMSDWFQACSGYEITADRKAEFDFTLPYLQTQSTFTVLPGNPNSFDPSLTDFSQFSIVHLNGAPTSTACLDRIGKTYGKVLIASDVPEVKAMLANGTADVLFSPRTKIDGLEVLPGNYQCDGGQGAGMMLRKGSNLASWWNIAFRTFYLSGKYFELCQTATENYGSPVACLPSPEKASSEFLQTMVKEEPTQVPDKLWKFVVSGRIAPFSFLNKNGKLTGFTYDLIQNVCEIAGKRCTLMLAEVNECTKRIDEFLYPGRGLMEGWMDGCTGYFNTVDRSNSWDFTSPYLLSNASFYVAMGNPKRFQPTSDDYSNFTIVYDVTAITNDHCLHRLNKKFNKILHAPNEKAAVNAVLTHKADVWFTKRVGVTGLDQLPGRYHCENVGTSIMVRKGSQVPSWWNPAFKFFHETGGFNNFCRTQGKMYNNYSFPCIPAPSMIKIIK